jgi:hypothetical protein
MCHPAPQHSKGSPDPCEGEHVGYDLGHDLETGLHGWISASEVVTQGRQRSGDDDGE